jgi:hypothetical protein
MNSRFAKLIFLCLLSVSIVAVSASGDEADDTLRQLVTCQEGQTCLPWASSSAYQDLLECFRRTPNQITARYTACIESDVSALPTRIESLYNILLESVPPRVRQSCNAIGVGHFIQIMNTLQCFETEVPTIQAEVNRLREELLRFGYRRAACLSLRERAPEGVILQCSANFRLTPPAESLTEYVQTVVVRGTRGNAAQAPSGRPGFAAQGPGPTLFRDAISECVEEDARLLARTPEGACASERPSTRPQTGRTDLRSSVVQFSSDTYVELLRTESIARTLQAYTALLGPAHLSIIPSRCLARGNPLGPRIRTLVSEHQRAGATPEGVRYAAITTSPAFSAEMQRAARAVMERANRLRQNRRFERNPTQISDNGEIRRLEIEDQRLERELLAYFSNFPYLFAGHDPNREAFEALPAAEAIAAAASPEQLSTAIREAREQLARDLAGQIQRYCDPSAPNALSWRELTAIPTLVSTVLQDHPEFQELQACAQRSHEQTDRILAAGKALLVVGCVASSFYPPSQRAAATACGALGTATIALDYTLASQQMALLSQCRAAGNAVCNDGQYLRAWSDFDAAVVGATEATATLALRPVAMMIRAVASRLPLERLRTLTTRLRGVNQTNATQAESQLREALNQANQASQAQSPMVYNAFRNPEMLPGAPPGARPRPAGIPTDQEVYNAFQPLRLGQGGRVPVATPARQLPSGQSGGGRRGLQLPSGLSSRPPTLEQLAEMTGAERQSVWRALSPQQRERSMRAWNTAILNRIERISRRISGRNHNRNVLPPVGPDGPSLAHLQLTPTQEGRQRLISDWLNTLPSDRQMDALLVWQRGINAQVEREIAAVATSPQARRLHQVFDEAGSPPASPVTREVTADHVLDAVARTREETSPGRVPPVLNSDQTTAPGFPPPPPQGTAPAQPIQD